ncbi:hypothetical protein NBT05_03175 [Aquimarina sp. ERC-38]|uniref:hypothetical protein n=1 Tax=Aquimarina sp. ERC-38 TaxID=2949996 RepID=UPI002245EC57|nr:hypothetical protein [Aquimarina sp. ERC-38]UZO81483.1 hypothetical protein NBT05_03175 [Aquimarina sp. ERC-38]
MNKEEAKKILKNVKESNFISSEIYSHLSNEVENYLEQEIKQEKNKVKKLISQTFNNDYKQAINYYNKALNIG